MKKYFFLFLFIVVHGTAQVKRSYPVYINYSDYTVKASVLNTANNIYPHESLTYFWYSANKIYDTQGSYDGKVLNGPYSSFFLSGNLKEQGYFKKGLKNGKWITWYENGKIKDIKIWNRGTQVSTQKTYNDSSELILKQLYYNGRLVSQTIYENGKAVKTTKFKNGKEVMKTDNDDTIKKPIKNPSKIPKTDNNREKKNVWKGKMQTYWGKIKNTFKKKSNSDKSEKT